MRASFTVIVSFGGRQNKIGDAAIKENAKFRSVSSMLQTWCSDQYLRAAIDNVASEFHGRGLSILVDQLHQAIQNDDDALAKSLEQKALDELHRGPWDKIWPRWRTLYMLSLLTQIYHHRGSQQQLLSLIDRALIFGDEFCRQNLTSYAEQISNNLADAFGEKPVFVDDSIVYGASYVGINPALGKPVARLRNCDVFRFHRDFVSPGIPVILEGLIDTWPSLDRRSFKNMTYLKRKMGFRTVIIESGRDYLNDPEWRPTLMTINEFIDSCILPDKPAGGQMLYLAQNDLFDQIPELSGDISVPDYIEFDPGLLSADAADSEFECRLPHVRTTVWFGSAGTLSPLHTDPQNNILCQVFGHKYVRLYEDSVEFRSLNDAGSLDEWPFLETRLSPGDALFIPKGMWHLVEALSKSFSVNFWWFYASD